MTSQGSYLTRRFSGHVRARRACLALGLTLILLSLLLTSCTLRPAPPDPFADLRQSWRAGFEVPAEQLRALPFYSITVAINPAEKSYTGALDLTLPVTGSRPLTELFFRSYPNLYTFGGALQVTGANVNGTTVNFGPAADRSAIHLSLPKPLEVGTQADIWLSFSGQVERASQPGEYTIFGFNEDVLSLTGFYPILAGRRGDEWAIDLPHPQGDVGFHDAALYRVTVTAPADQGVIATGAEITHTLGADGWRTTRYALGPAREFTLLLSPSLQMTETVSLGTRVRSYFYPADAAAGRLALYHAVAALEVYSDRFGGYPYRDMAVVEAPLTYHGMEFPAVSLIGSQVYSKFGDELEALVVHEVAHQWWYNQVGSDQVRSPWLDEGLAEFSMYEYYAGRYGEPRAQKLRALRWQIPVDALVSRGADRPIGLPVREYVENYETLIYGKGALFFAALRDELGADKFEQLLRTYLARYRWQIATPAAFQALAEEVAGRTLDGLFAEWVHGK